AVNLAAFLGDFGKKVLLIDLDPQANATSGIGIDKKSVKNSIYNVIIGGTPLENILLESPSRGVFVAPANLPLVGSEVELVNADRRELRLIDSLNQYTSINRYDFVIIDTPPSLG